MAYTVEIDWKNGTEIYTNIAIKLELGQTKPLLKKVSSIRRVISLKGMENSKVTIELLNKNNYFTTKLNSLDRDIYGRNLRIKRKSILIFTGQVCGIPNLEKNILTIIADTLTRFKTPANYPITKDIFPNMPENNVGKFCNIFYGDASEKTFYAYRIDTNKYLANWEQISYLTKATNKDEIDITSSCTLSYDSLTKRSYIIYNSNDDYIYFSGKGKLDEGGTVIDSPVQILQEILNKFINITIVNYSTAMQSFKDRGFQKNCLFIQDETELLKLLELFQISYSCRFSITTDYKIKIHFVSLIGRITTKKISSSSIYNFQTRKEKQLPTKETRIEFAFNPQNSNYTKTLILKPEFYYSYETKKIEAKYCNTTITAFITGARETFYNEMNFTTVSFEIHPDESIDLGDIIETTSLKSFFNSTKIEILKIELEQNKTIKIEGIDLTEFDMSCLILKTQSDLTAIKIYERGNNLNPQLWFAN